MFKLCVTPTIPQFPLVVYTTLQAPAIVISPTSDNVVPSQSNTSKFRGLRKSLSFDTLALIGRSLVSRVAKPDQKCVILHSDFLICHDVPVLQADLPSVVHTEFNPLPW